MLANGIGVGVPFANLGRTQSNNSAASPLSGFFSSFWKLADLTDAIGGNTLTNNGSATFVAGKIGNCVSLASASSQFLSITDNPSFSFTNKLSLAWWMNPTNLAAQQIVVGKWTYQTDGGWVVELETTGKVRIYIATSAADTGSGCQMEFDSSVTAGSWFCGFMVYDGTQTGDANRLKLWVNNVQRTLSVVFGAVPAALQNDGASFLIGKFGGTLTRFFNGKIDAVGIAGSVANATQVAAFYNGGTGIEPPF